MSIIRLEDKYKSKYKLELTPRRHYVSSSSGVTGSVYVFPNRSSTQKDNIDERLNFAATADGEVVKPYDSNSLEARREEIYRGNFSKLIGGAFTDALEYTYEIALSGFPQNGEYTGEDINYKMYTDPVWTFWNGTIPVYTSPIKVRRKNDGVIFTWTSELYWTTGVEIFNTLPESDRDRNGQNYEIALGLLLDGAHPFAEDHAWRKQVIELNNSDPITYSLGNSSFSGGNPDEYQFTGRKIIEDETGWPYRDSPLTSKEEVNAWPPEIEKWGASIITNFVVKGYSDLSMHPRNNTRKEIKVHRSNQDLWSKGSMAQRNLANRIETIGAMDAGWFIENKQSLCLSEYTDPSGNVKKPCLAYYNDSDMYSIDWSQDSSTIEFWIKPCEEQIDVGTIVCVQGNYAVCLIPSIDDFKNGIPERFKIGIYSQNTVGDDLIAIPSMSDVTLGGSGGGKYISTPILRLNRWSHVAIRFSSRFNNGLLSVYVDGVNITSVNVDGIYDGASRTNGIFDTTLGLSAGDTMFVGGWCPDGQITEHIWGDYSSKQSINPVDNSGAPLFTHSVADGAAIIPRFQLVSELSELRLWNTPRTESEILASKNYRIKDTEDLRAYIPVIFDPSGTSPIWDHVGFIPFTDNPETLADYYEKGSFLTIDKSNLDYNKVPYCTNSGYIAGMPFVNVHAHLKEYKNSSYPAILQFGDLSDTTDSTIYPTIREKSPASHKINYFLENWKEFNWLRSNNSMILPSDNPYLVDGYEITESKYSLGLDSSWINLKGLDVGSLEEDTEMGRMFDDEVFSVQSVDEDFSGTSEEYSTAALKRNGKIFDNDILVPFAVNFSIPQIYYANRIKPGSLILKSSVNGLNKTITIVDNEGTLYRKDSMSDGLPTKVGHVDYSNGLVSIFSPYLSNMSIDDFDISFEGLKNMHVMQIDVPCPTGIANVSQHPSYKDLKPSNNSNEATGKMTYISTIYLHDENLNIIGKANLAQPLQKRETDSFLFRLKLDF